MNFRVKISTLLQGSLLLFGLPCLSQQRITASEAADYVGQIVTVCDVVSGGKSLPKVTLLNMGGAYPNQLFTIVINGDAKRNFTVVPETHYLNKAICVSGKIELYKGKPQINILSHLDIAVTSAPENTFEKRDPVPVKKAKGVLDSNQRILSKPIKVRRGPGTSFDFFHTLNAGDTIELVNSRNGWSLISFKPKEKSSTSAKGFIPGSALQ